MKKNFQLTYLYLYSYSAGRISLKPVVITVDYKSIQSGKRQIYEYILRLNSRASYGRGENFCRLTF